MKQNKTTFAGIASIIAAVATAVMAMTDNDPLTVPDWTLVGSAVMAGIGLIFSRDWNSSDANEGLK